MSPSENKKQKIAHFFGSPSDEKEFATMMRKLMFQSTILALKADENRVTPDNEVISEGCIFLNALCEVLEEENEEADAEY